MTHDLSQKSSWIGLWTALVTPFHPDGSVDAQSLQGLIEHQIKNGIRGLIIAGSTGEGGLLSPQHYKELLIAAESLTQRRIPLIAGLGTGGTDSCLEKLRVAKEAGFQGVLVSPPAYVRPPQRGLIEHYKIIAAQGLPVCVYEIPGRSACSIELATLDSLATIPGIVAVKDASANLQRAIDSCGRVGHKLAMLSGDDGTFQPFLAAGGVGLMSVASHFVPRALLEIQKLMSQGKHSEASALQAKINPFVDALFCESNPIPTKALLHDQKRIQYNLLKGPLVPLGHPLLPPLQKVYAGVSEWA